MSNVSLSNPNAKTDKMSLAQQQQQQQGQSQQLLDNSSSVMFDNSNAFKGNSSASSQNVMQSSQKQQQQQQQQQRQVPPSVQQQKMQQDQAQQAQQDSVFKAAAAIQNAAAAAAAAQGNQGASGASIVDMINERTSQQQQQQQQQQSQQEQALSSALHQINFGKDPNEDMKLSFFDQDLTQLSDETKSAAAKVVATMASLPKMQQQVMQNSIISPSQADLNMKIASVKKVWEVPVMPTVLEHAGQVDVDAGHLSGANFSTQHQQLHQFAHAHTNMAHMQHAISPGASYSNFGQDPNSLEQHFTSKSSNVQQVDSIGDNENVSHNSNQYSAVGNQHGHVSQVSGMKGHGGGSDALNNVNVKVKPSQQQMQQSGLSGLSPPPQMQQNAIQTAPQSYYQASQTYGMSAIPSPPAVLFNSSQAAGLYNSFQIEAGRSQFSQYPGHYGATGNAPAYANFMQQAPPSMQPSHAGHAEIYQNLASQFRTMGGVQPAPFNQSQQMSNQNTVLISSTSNTLMSASVKPSSQQIGAIGSKSGQPYGQQYMNLYPQQPPQLQSNNYFSNASGGQAGAFFGTPTAANTQNYGIQAATGMFSQHGTPTPNNAGPPQQQVATFGSQYSMNTQMLAAATTMNPQQYRGGPGGQGNANAQSGYLKSSGQPNQSHMQDSVSGTSFFK